MDARIGKLMRDGSTVYYKTEGGYTEGTLAQVEAALGLPASSPAPVATTKATQACKSYDVRLSFEFPAWDEKDGILYRGILATSRAAANAAARRMASDDGHMAGGKGRTTFKATEND